MENKHVIYIYESINFWWSPWKSFFFYCWIVLNIVIQKNYVLDCVLFVILGVWFTCSMRHINIEQIKRQRHREIVQEGMSSLHLAQKAMAMHSHTGKTTNYQHTCTRIQYDIEKFTVFGEVRILRTSQYAQCSLSTDHTHQHKYQPAMCAYVIE